MKRRIGFSNKMIIILFIALFLFSCGLETKNATLPSSSYQIMKTNDQVIEKPFSFDLTPHEHIEIDSDSDFITYGFPGSGTEIDPYIIENYEIISSSDNGISIRDTTRYFVIQDCYVDAKDNGIRINNVVAGTTTIINNTCTNNNYYGIYLSGSSGATLTNNTCTNNGDGIYLSYSYGSTLTNNTGTYNNYRGIHLSYSSGSTLTNNTCSFNNLYGICLYSSDSCHITDNFLQENEDYGIYLSYNSDNNIIYHNVFIFNNLGGTSQAYDNGMNNLWYNTSTNKGNYWSDWSGSGVYSIEGPPGVSDPYPLSLEDTDSDGLVDILEIIVYHTNPSLNDTDSDGLSDGDEVNIYETDPLDTDTDSDGLSDGDEVNIYETDPLDTDTDSDGLSDGDEVNSYGTDPNNIDSDGDEYSDFEEINAGKDPLDPNSHPLRETEKMFFFMVLPILACVAILAFVVPKYVVPYARNTIIPGFTVISSEKKTRRRKEITLEKVVRTPVIVPPRPSEQISKDLDEVSVSKDEEDLIYCSSCGKKVNKSLKFCSSCGTTFEE